MGGLKVFDIRGIDQKSNHLNRPINALTDSLNMRRTADSAWETRAGFCTEQIFSADFAYFSKTHQEQLFFKKTAPYFYRKKNGQVKKISSSIGQFYIPHQNSSVNLGSKLLFNDGVTRTCYISYGWYSGIQLAVELQNKLNSVSTNFTVTFSNGKFVFSRTASFSFTISDGPSAVSSVWPFIGFPLKSLVDILPTVDGAIYKITSAESNTWDFETLSIAEYQGSVYIASSNNSFPVLKYDGNFVYEAGLLNTDHAFPFNGTIAAGSDSAAMINYITDINGNIVFSPIRFDDKLRSTYLYTSQNFFSLNKYVWFLKLGYSSLSYPLIYVQTLSKTNRTFYGYVDTNMVAGDKVLFQRDRSPFSSGLDLNIIEILEPENRLFVELEIEKVVNGNSNASLITFTESSLSGVEVRVGNSNYAVPSASWPDSSRVAQFPIVIDKSTMTLAPVVINGDGVYKIPILFSNFGNILGESYHDNALTLQDFSTLPVASDPELSRFYSDLTSKIRPPICKFVAAYGDQLVFGNISGFYDESNNLTSYSNDDLVMYSDVELGDFGENLSEVNRQKIGESFDGLITGLRRANDSLIVFKDSGVFSLDGTLISGQFSLRKISSNLVGCLSGRSIIDADEGLVFQSSTGIHFTNGTVVKKISEQLDTLFTDTTLDLTKTIGSQWKKEELVIFYLSNGKCVIYDYLYRDWYIWDGINASGGFFETKDFGFSFFDKNKLYKFNSSQKDNGLDIDCYLKTSWIDNKNPSNVKKFHSVRVFSFIECIMKVKTESDWVENGQVQSVDAIINGSTRIDFDQRNCHSLRLTFGSNSYIKIAGFEIEVTENGQRDKN